MATEDQSAFEVWQKLKPDTKFALRELTSALHKPDDSPADVIEAYLFAKRALAQSMQALLRSQLPATSRAAFHEVRARIKKELHSNFSGQVPNQCLQVPYGSKANEELFAILHQEIGSPVDSARLRTINADDIHTERRIRELRELGLNIPSVQVNGNQHYMLDSLDLNNDRIRQLVVKSVRKTQALSDEDKKRLVAQLSQ